MFQQTAYFDERFQDNFRTGAVSSQKRDCDSPRTGGNRSRPIQMQLGCYDDEYNYK